MARKKDTEMAIAERELATDEIVTDQTDATNSANDEEDDEDPTSEKAKRERVNLETADPNMKVTLTIAVPAGLKLALTKLGETDGIIASAWARNKLAELASYEIPASFTERQGRTRKYATPEAAKEAAKLAAKTNRDRVKAMLKALEANPELAAQLQASIGQ